MLASKCLRGQPTQPLACPAQIPAPLPLPEQAHAHTKHWTRCRAQPRVGVDPKLDLARVEPFPHFPRHLALLDVALECPVRPTPDPDRAMIDGALDVGDLSDTAAHDISPCSTWPSSVPYGQ